LGFLRVLKLTVPKGNLTFLDSSNEFVKSVLYSFQPKEARMVITEIEARIAVPKETRDLIKKLAKSRGMIMWKMLDKWVRMETLKIEAGEGE
jgi:hypothetical protein